MQRWSSNSAETDRPLLRRLTYPVIAIPGACIFMIFAYYSLFYTRYMLPRHEEITLDRKDQPLFRLAFLALLIAAGLILRFLDRKLSAKAKKIMEGIMLALSMLFIGVAGFMWISSLDRIPEGDQAFIYGGASYFLEGNYAFFSEGGYCQIYPGQLGQMALVELIFAVVGTYRYFVLEVISVILAMGIHGLGYLLLREMGRGFSYRMLYFLLMMGNLPLIFYTSWVYGDLPSVFFMLAAAFFALRLHHRGRVVYGALTIVSYVLASLTRKNSMIFLIAFLILAVIYTISYKRWRMLLTGVLALLCSFLCYRGIEKMYELRSGYAIGSGMPATSWIAMGMQESRFGCGWYNNYPKEIGEKLNWDFDAVAKASKTEIKERMDAFIHNPSGAMRFYKNKVLSQWNQPLYQSVYFSAKYQGVDEPAPGSFCFGLYYTEDGYFDVLSFADGWQFLIYLGVFFFYLTAVRTKEEPMTYLMAVTVIGGVLFSILWEAKARYSFPYYVMMFSMAAVGYGKSAALFTELVRKLFAGKARTIERQPLPDGRAADS